VQTDWWQTLSRKHSRAIADEPALGLGPPTLVGGNVEGAGDELGGAADWHPDLETANSTAGQKSTVTAFASAGGVPLRAGKEGGQPPRQWSGLLPKPDPAAKSPTAKYATAQKRGAFKTAN
jgi:hypothetical protein